MHHIRNALFTEESSYRPFKRHRPQFNIIQVYRGTKRFLNSTAGKAVTYAVAEAAGFYFGSIVCAPAMAELGSLAGKSLIPAVIKSLALISCPVTLYVLVHKTSRFSRRLFPAIASISASTWYMSSSTGLAEYGYDAGLGLGGAIGRTAGPIIFGFASLKLVGSNVVMWDSNNHWNAYSIRMLRYIVVGNAMKGFTALPNPFYRVIMQVVVIVSQQIAYNSNVVFPALRECVKKGGLPRRVLVSSLAGMVNNRFFGNNPAQFAREMSHWLTPSLSNLPSMVQRAVETGVRVGVERGVESIANHTNLFVMVSARSFYKFSNLIRQSDKIMACHQAFLESFFDRSLPIDLRKRHIQENKEKLIAALKDKINSENSFYGHIFNPLIDMIVSDQKIGESVEKVLLSIKEMELELIGSELLSKTHSDYIKEIVQIYLHHYIIYTVFKYHELANEISANDEFSDLSALEENNIILDLNTLLVSLYVGSITSSPVTRVALGLSNSMIRSTFEIKSFVNRRLFQQPEHESFILLRQKTEEHQAHLSQFSPRHREEEKKNIEAPATREKEEDNLFQDCVLISLFSQENLGSEESRD